MVYCKHGMAFWKSIDSVLATEIDTGTLAKLLSFFSKDLLFWSVLAI